MSRLPRVNWFGFIKLPKGEGTLFEIACSAICGAPSGTEFWKKLTRQSGGICGANFAWRRPIGRQTQHRNDKLNIGQSKDDGIRRVALITG
jgi:hypothetical protein